MNLFPNKILKNNNALDLFSKYIPVPVVMAQENNPADKECLRLVRSLFFVFYRIP